MVFPNAKDDGKEANKVPQKLSRHLEECQNVEKVPKTLKCAYFFCQFAHFIPNDEKEATKALKKFERVPKRKKKTQFAHE